MRFHRITVVLFVFVLVAFFFAQGQEAWAGEKPAGGGVFEGCVEDIRFDEVGTQYILVNEKWYFLENDQKYHDVPAKYVNRQLWMQPRKGAHDGAKYIRVWFGAKCNFSEFRRCGKGYEPPPPCKKPCPEKKKKKPCPPVSVTPPRTAPQLVVKKDPCLPDKGVGKQPVVRQPNGDPVGLYRMYVDPDTGMRSHVPSSKEMERARKHVYDPGWDNESSSPYSPQLDMGLPPAPNSLKYRTPGTLQVPSLWHPNNGPGGQFPVF